MDPGKIAGLVRSLWTREQERVRPTMDKELGRELRALQRRGLFPNPSSVTPARALAAAAREGETVLDAALSETLDELGKAGASIEDLVHGVALLR